MAVSAGGARMAQPPVACSGPPRAHSAPFSMFFAMRSCLHGLAHLRWVVLQHLLDAHTCAAHTVQARKPCVSVTLSKRSHRQWLTLRSARCTAAMRLYDVMVTPPPHWHGRANVTQHALAYVTGPCV